MKRHPHSSFIVIAAGLLAAATGHSAVLLQDYTLGGTQQKVSWESSEAGGTIAAGGALSASASGAPTTGTGTAAVNAPGFKASSGFYSFSTDFSMTASTSIQGNAFDDIQNVVFQRTSIDTGVENLAHGGGPLLSYFIDGSPTAAGTVAASYFGIGPETIGNAQGTYYAYSYQWDLSGVAGNITSVSITAPIPVHSSTVEAQIDIGSGFVQVVPEPATSGLAAFGLAGLLIRRRRRC